MRSRKSSITASTNDGPASAAGPVDFSLKTEEEILGLNSEATDSVQDPEHHSSGRDSVFGVQSLSEALDEAFGDQSHESHKDTAEASSRKEEMETTSTPLSHSAVLQPPRTPTNIPKHLHYQSTSVSQPLTPIQLASPAVDWSSNMPSTPKSGSLGSLRLSDVDSQADIEESVDGATDTDRQRQTESAPQLVMPSLAMPDRRPFTERGKAMGRLKICVVGRKGSGKSSLIRAIVKQSEDIVQVDPLAVSTSYNQRRKSFNGSNKPAKPDASRDVNVLEYMASTKPYPSWWNEGMEDSRLLKRRKSFGDVVLERNLCFVDTPGYDDQEDRDIFTFNQDHSAKYIEDKMMHHEIMSELTDLERLNLLSSKGGALVDVVLFVFTSGKSFHSTEIQNLTMNTESTLSRDIEHFKELAVLTNVVPVIGKSDTLSPAQISSLKEQILLSLHRKATPFLFGRSPLDLVDQITETRFESSKASVQVSVDQASDVKEAQSETKHQSPTQPIVPPFAISTLAGNDAHEMDASLLMSSTYSPPLLPSELDSLVDHIFNPDHMLWLRHSAARKFLAWRARNHQSGISTNQMLIQRRASDSLTTTRTSRPSATRGVSSPFASTGIWNDARILETLPHTERASWLLQRINEEVSLGTIGLTSQSMSGFPSSIETSAVHINEETHALTLTTTTHTAPTTTPPPTPNANIRPHPSAY